MTVRVEPVTAQPVELPALNVTVPSPEPAEGLADKVEVLPYVSDVGAVKVIVRLVFARPAVVVKVVTEDLQVTPGIEH